MEIGRKNMDGHQDQIQWRVFVKTVPYICHGIT